MPNMKFNVIAYQLKLALGEAAARLRDSSPGRFFASLPPRARKIVGYSFLALFSVLIGCSIFLFSANASLTGVKSDDCVVEYDEDQAGSFKRAAVRLDRLPGLEVSIHTVVNKENFWKIAKTNGINIDTILGANPWLPDLLARRGEEIVVLNQRGVLHVVRRGETMASIGELYKISAGEIRKSNLLFFLAGARPGSILFVPGAGPRLMSRKIYDNFLKRKLFISPASGKRTSSFGWREHPLTHARNFHTGMDIRAKYGSLVCAAAGGVVVVAGMVSGYGKLVVIQHANGFTTYYAHNSALLVHSGQIVHKGQPISRAGNSGTSTGTHVHFEVRKDGKPEDPANYLW